MIQEAMFSSATTNEAEKINMGSRRGGKQAAMDAMAEEILRTHPGARLAKVSIVDGQEQVKVTEAAGELVRGADGVYRPNK